MGVESNTVLKITNNNMNNLLFTALLMALLYYFFYYLPSQKKLVSNPNPIKLTHSQTTQTDPHPIEKTVDCPSPQIIKDNQELDELKRDIEQKEKTIIGLNNSYQKLEKEKVQEIKELQSQIRDLAKRPSKPTNSKGTQTDELTNTLDTLIKDIQDLNNSLN